MTTLVKRRSVPTRLSQTDILRILPTMRSYRKKTPIKAVQLDYEFMLEVTNGQGVKGRVTCDAGTWLAINGQGMPYPIPAKQFAEMYEELT